MIILQIGFLALALIGLAIILTTKNLLHAAYALALVLVSIAGIYVLLNAELLAIVQLLLYAVGVIILLVFGVMITSRAKGGKLVSESRKSVLAGILSLATFLGLIYLFSQLSISRAPILGDQVKAIGQSFLTEHLVAFELVAFVLLVALVGASYLAKMSSND